ncbi:YqiA/YcfP family alpha/beta fold hydrolase [Salinibius halmophilus]|uniref:YqiA/YcfP family alpha/beta fold hydrolase n=1 Tax=Salinibius halmophilus TaxID=1853216 RepID=UPI000E671260|nr:YqiA/YcfP family alpha/beta fold hydrolase [Salinibius halmophilus]
MPQIVKTGDASSPLIIFAHGAGAGMYSDFMEEVSAKLVELNLQVLRFEFDYMTKIRESGRKRPPERLPKLIEQFEQVIQDADKKPSLLVGKSMGGRLATMVGRTHNMQSAVLGYPFHAIGRTIQDDRIAHLKSDGASVTIFQGSLDNMGAKEEVSGLSGELINVDIHWLEAANHDLKPRATTNRSQSDYLSWACQEIAKLAFKEQ